MALDLANTISFRGTPRAADHIASFEALLAWSAQAGTLGADTVGFIRREVLADRATTERVVTDVGRLRDAIFRIGGATAAGAEPAGEDLATLHGFAHVTLGAGCLAPVRGGKLVFDFRSGGVYAAIVGPLAWAAIALFTSDRLDRLKQCPPADCQWLFLDQTKNGSRRWCEMATCGNRDKAARHRNRKSSHRGAMAITSPKTST